MSDDERAVWRRRSADRATGWRHAAERGIDPTAAEAQELAREHVGPAELYVADPRFAATYSGPDGATFVRDALVAFVEGRGG